tara:strand:+ start:2608 stop:2949 length:342 start_codon:yes stop_codon:yes gene_type:complete
MSKSTKSITGYHAHVYYDTDNKKIAERLRRRVKTQFNINLGRWHDNPIGPHPKGMYQIEFRADIFSSLVTWMVFNRDDLSILVHPLTGDDLADHTSYSMWLGESLKLRLSKIS